MRARGYCRNTPDASLPIDARGTPPTNSPRPTFAVKLLMPPVKLSSPANSPALRAGRRDNIDRRPTVRQIGESDGPLPAKPPTIVIALDSAGKPTFQKNPAAPCPNQAAHSISALHAPARPHRAQTDHHCRCKLRQSRRHGLRLLCARRPIPNWRCWGILSVLVSTVGEQADVFSTPARSIYKPRTTLPPPSNIACECCLYWKSQSDQNRARRPNSESESRRYSTRHPIKRAPPRRIPRRKD